MTEPPGFPSRRSFLKASAAGVALTGMAVSAKAQPAEPPPPLEEYQPEYFNADEWAFIMAATARLIPSEGDAARWCRGRRLARSWPALTAADDYEHGRPA